MFGWIQRLKRRHHEYTFLATLDELDSFKALIADEPCPACGQRGNSLQLERFTRNLQGWDAEVSCTNCFFRGFVNSEGFSFKKIHSKGRARR